MTKFECIEFLKLELNNFGLEITPKPSSREGVDYIIGTNEIYLQSIDLDSERSVKISKNELDELKSNLFVALVLIIDNEPKAIYFIPSTQLAKPDDYIFIDNEVSVFPSLSNWEIKVFTNAVPELNKYALENVIDKLKS